MSTDETKEMPGLARRWRELAAPRGAAEARLVQRGEALVRRGAVEDLRIVPGKITATVRDERGGPCDVALRWPVAEEESWGAAVEVLSDELRFTAALLDHVLPEDLVDRLAGTGVALAPEPDELLVRCSCDGEASRCRHLVATFTALATLVERDPSQLLLLRGRDPERLLREVRAAESGVPRGPAGVDPDRGLEEPAGDLDRIRLHPAPAEEPAALFLHLADPPGVDDASEFVAIIERAAAGAWRLAAGEGAAMAEEELLLAELRGLRVASAPSLAAALGRGEEEVRDELDRLFERGLVLRTGSGERARYRASSS